MYAGERIYFSLRCHHTGYITCIWGTRITLKRIHLVDANLQGFQRVEMLSLISQESAVVTAVARALL
jgi:hypothetical protein